nr:DUF6541 family protein [Microbacterium sp.]
MAIYAGSAVIAPWFGISWSLLMPAVVTAVAATAAFLLGRMAQDDEVPTSKSAYLWALGALTMAGVILVTQFAYAFVGPEAIAQRFDNILHLNALQHALETRNASAFNVGKIADVSFYPNAWHSLATLTASLTGADVPTAVNAANIAIVATIWPASNLALAGALFRDRASAFVTAAALSTAFGAFPALFFDWGVLYPNALGYALIPAVLAVVVRMMSARGWRLIRDVLLILVLTAGTTLAHPNALLAAVLFGSLLTIGITVRSAIEQSARRTWIRAGIIAVAAVIACITLWSYARTSAEHSRWPPYQNIPQAIGSGLVISPSGHAPTILIVLLLLAGFIAIARQPRLLPVALPFIASVALFVLVSAFPVNHPLRIALTNPWYSDPNRIAALLPMTAIPVLTAGAIWAVDMASARLSRMRAAMFEGTRRILIPVATAICFILLFTVAFGNSVRGPLSSARAAYTDDAEYSIVSADERALLARLPGIVPQEALLIGSPRTGASLAYALAGRHVTEMHIFGTLSSDERFLNAHLREIDDDPAVCEAINRLDVDYVLDFGSFDVSGDQDPRGYSGVVDLSPSSRLSLVDAEGDARLFRVDGC